jgi:magnesium-transporting ATPase (P-type)
LLPKHKSLGSIPKLLQLLWGAPVDAMVQKKEDRFPRSDTVQGPDITLEEALTEAWRHHYTSVLRALGVEDYEHGLNKKDVQSRLQEYGANQLEGGDDISLFKIIMHQIVNAMTLVSLPVFIRIFYTFLPQHLFMEATLQRSVSLL